MAPDIELECDECLPEPSLAELERIGIGERRRVAQEEGHRLATKAKPGMWFAAQARNHNTIWVGKFADKGDGSTVIKKVEERSEEAPSGMGVRTLGTEVVDGTHFTRGDYMLAVEWWDLDPSDPESRTYKKWVPPGGSPRQHVLNSTELRAIDFTMEPVMPAASPPLQQVRRLLQKQMWHFLCQLR